MRSRSEVKKEVTKRILAELIKDAWDETNFVGENIDGYADPITIAEYLIKLGVTIPEGGQYE